MATTPGGSNTYVPELTDSVVASFSANPNSFPLNKYVQLIPVDKDTGYYARIGREEAGRLQDSDLYGDWADGSDAPTFGGELEEHSFVAYKTQRKPFNYVIGMKGQEQAAFDVRAKHAAVKAEQAMRRRTQLVINAATTTGNYDSSHVLTVANISGNSGKLDESTTARSDIKRTLNYMFELLEKDTLNAIKPEDVIFVLSGGCARKLAQTQELIDHLKGSPDAYAMFTGELKNAGKYGLPLSLYGFPVVIENTYKVTTIKGASSKTTTLILPDTTPFMCSRVGGLSDGKLGTPSFSTLGLFVYEDMTVEEETMTWDRKIRGRVTDDVQAQVIAPVSGVLLQSAVAA